MNKNKVYKYIIYGVGLLILAFGICLNTKTGLGVSPIISVSLTVSEIFNQNFGDMTFILYVLFVLVEVILHILLFKQGRLELSLKKTLTLDILQLPISLVFSRFINIFSIILPDFATDFQGQFLGSFASRIVFLLIAILCTGIGAILSLSMRIIPNPGDGIVQVLSDFTNKEVGLVKNYFDGFNVTLTCIISLILAHKIIGIGIGTLLAILGVGRVISFIDSLFHEKLNKVAQC